METRDTVEQAAAQFIARRDIGPWTETDAAALQSWLAQSVSHRAAYYRLNAAWMETGRLNALGAGRMADARDVSAETGIRPAALIRVAGSTTLRRRAGWFAVAAGTVAAAVGTFAWHRLMDQGNKYTTPIGATEAVPLPDGSRITLNTDSTIRISLGQNERRIDLDQGEAYFDVARDPARPFVVRVGTRRVVAVGTQFSVRRDRDELKVVVAEGVVRFEGQGVTSSQAVQGAGLTGSSRSEILLPAGTIARAAKDALLVQERTLPEVRQNLSWRTGLLTFRGTPLAEAVAEFNRYNTRKIVVDDPRIATLQVGGIFRATNIEPFVHLLEEGFPVQASIGGDQIVLTSRP